MHRTVIPKLAILAVALAFWARARAPEQEDYFVMPASGQQLFTSTKAPAANTVVKVFRNGLRSYPKVDFTAITNSAGQYQALFLCQVSQGSVSMLYFPR